MRGFSAARLVGLLFVVAAALAGDETTMDNLSAALGLATRTLMLLPLAPALSHAGPKSGPHPFCRTMHRGPELPQARLREVLPLQASR